MCSQLEHFCRDRSKPYYRSSSNDSSFAWHPLCRLDRTIWFNWSRALLTLLQRWKGEGANFTCVFLSRSAIFVRHFPARRVSQSSAQDAVFNYGWWSDSVQPQSVCRRQSLFVVARNMGRAELGSWRKYSTPTASFNTIPDLRFRSLFQWARVSFRTVWLSYELIGCVCQVQRWWGISTILTPD